MSTEIESKWKTAIDKSKPLLAAFLADLEREATLIKERDLDPRKLSEEPRVQDARSSAVEALEQITEFAKSLDGLLRTYAGDLDKKIDVNAIKEQLATVSDLNKKVDVNAIKEQLASASAAGRAHIEDSNGHAVAERIRTSSDETREKVEEAARKSKLQVEAAAEQSKEQISSAAQKGKDSTVEMVAALGWAAAAAAVIYLVFMDEKRREQSKKLAKAAASGAIIVVSSAKRRQ